MSRWTSLVFAVLLALSAARPLVSLAEDEVKSEVDFNRDIRPILSEHCFACHGPDAGKRKGGKRGSGGLRLDKSESAMADLGGHAAIVPGKPESSKLIQRILADDEDVMPPADHHKPLKQYQKDLLVRWIQAGAEYADHWVFNPVRHGKAPKVTPRHQDFVSNWIDFYIISRLEQHGRSPSPPADRRTLIRRVSFDIIGLPPTTAEVEAFVADRSVHAFEKVVDRLLASPHFGERLAAYWLDLVRYADSNGYHADLAWSVSPYRDYVIRAFNTNMPFDRFTREQLGGDLMPKATLAQQVAAGFNRLNMKSTEFGIQDKEYLAKYASDRVRTTSGVWMGLTIGCAECHDHKFDPITTRDFYRFAAFFADIKQKGFYPNVKRDGWGERIEVPDPETGEQLVRFKTQLAELKETLNAPQADWDAAQKEWETKTSTGADPTVLLADARHGGRQWRYTFTRPASDWTEREFPDDGWKTGASGFGSPGTPNGKIRTHWTSSDIWMRTDFEISQKPKNVFLQIQHDEDADVFLDGVRIASLKGYSNGSEAYTVVPLDDKTKSRFEAGPHVVAVHCHQTSGGQFIDIGLTTAEKPGKQEELLPILKKPAASRSQKERDMLRDAFRQQSPLTKSLRDRIVSLESTVKETTKSIPTMLATVSVEPRQMRVLPRGNWMDDSGDVVEPGVPEFMQQIKSENRATRLDLANWLVNRDHPLTARVFVNRLWKLYFGTGLSKVLDDMGAQGEVPSHPELLDRLAFEFMESGWDIKLIIKQLVMSRTYRQSSLPETHRDDPDPYNRLLARQSRYRFDAEMIRDNALAVSGLLVRDVGGPSVKPYQPKGYWAHLFFPRRTYQHDTGSSQYRRAVYTHWQRQFLHPALKIFDAPPREECTAERSRSNTPLGALALLNDTSQVEAARVLAAQLLDQAGEGQEARLQWLAQRTLARNFNPAEVTVLQDLLAKHQRHYTEDPKAAGELVAVGLHPVSKDHPAGELAAWTSVVRAVLNMHEMITRN